MGCPYRDRELWGTFSLGLCNLARASAGVLARKLWGRRLREWRLGLRIRTDCMLNEGEASRPC